MGDNAAPSHFLPEDLFNDALELPPGEREAFISTACGDDATLRETLRGMLALAERDPSLTAEPENATVPARLGKYELLEERGRGGMGVVYAARDLQLGRVVALKLLPAWLAQDPQARERFFREAQLLAAMSDERIATLYSLDEADGFHFLTMEMIPGRTLADRLGDGPLPPAQALALVQQVAEAVARAHERHIVHRDLKPANLMITPGGGAKILDFGIARVLHDPHPRDGDHAHGDERLTSARGTPGYMAPEQFAGGPVDERCDVWALGCVLFEALSGRRAVEALDERGRLDPGGLPPRLPPPVHDLLCRCLERDPRRREISADRMAQVLRQALASGGERRRRRYMLAILVLALAGPLAIVSKAVLDHQRRGPVTSIELAERRVLRAHDVEGRLLWARSMPGAVVGSTSGPKGELIIDSPKVIKVGDEVRGVSVATYGAGPDDPGALWLLSPDDGRPLWKWPLAWQRPVNAQSSLRANWTALLPWPGREEPIIALNVSDSGWYGTAMQFLDLAGRTLGTYHHPGSFRVVLPLAADADHPLRYVLAGLNSSARFVRDLTPFETREHLGCVVILQPPDLSGQGYPYSEGLPEPRDWPGMPRARELSYLAIPLIHPDLSSRIMGLSSSRGSDGELTLTVITVDGRYYFLDEDLRPRSCYVQTNTVADSLQARGEARFLPLMLIKDGRTDWVTVPTTF